MRGGVASIPFLDVSCLGSCLDLSAKSFLDRTVLGLYFRIHDLATVSDNSVR